MDSPDTWRWIWLAAAAMFFVGEMATPGSFYMLPFAVGGGAAALAAFLGVDVTVQWAVFGGVSVITFLALRPIADRLDHDVDDTGIGAKRLVGATAVVAVPIAGEDGTIRFESEDWRAVSEDGSVLAAGTPVTIVEVRGTRAVVRRRA